MCKKLFLILVPALLMLAGCSEKAAEWQPVGERIMTDWVAEINPANPHPEYPRPTLVREGSWHSLNGMWEYAVTPQDAAQPDEFEGHILVPYPIESALSGVGRALKADEALWYKTSFRLPKSWREENKTVKLNFGAVDWQCEAWLNGEYLGIHTGGYTSFSFDLENAVSKKEMQTLVLKVIDRTDDDSQPRGKQVSEPRGIWYTSVSGIWQSVWLESVADVHVGGYRVESDVENGLIKVYVESVGADAVEVELLEGGVGYSTEEPGEANVIAAAAVTDPLAPAVFKLDAPQLWSPDSPYLYGLRLTAKSGDAAADVVRGYAAIRSISVIKDKDGHKRMAINGEPLFHYGPLDQGWWPDGLYTAPTDEALKFDIEKTKDFGFNMIRKHIKVEPERWYYHCDRLGVFVWQDMPSMCGETNSEWNRTEYGGGKEWDAPQSAKNTYYKEWGEIIAQLYNHPSIVMWVPFNEAWAQFDTQDAVLFTRAADGSRLINAASGGNFVKGAGDILDCHNYPHPHMQIWDKSIVNVLGEYGGIGLPLEGHLWQPDKNWGYIQYKSGEDVFKAYAEYAEMLKKLIDEGCAAAVYTQTTDVEIEVNGLMTYDRKVIKMDEQKLKAVNLSVIESM